MRQRPAVPIGTLAAEGQFDRLGEHEALELGDRRDLRRPPPRLRVCVARARSQHRADQPHLAAVVERQRLAVDDAGDSMRGAGRKPSTARRMLLATFGACRVAGEGDRNTGREHDAADAPLGTDAHAAVQRNARVPRRTIAAAAAASISRAKSKGRR